MSLIELLGNIMRVSGGGILEFSLQRRRVKKI